MFSADFSNIFGGELPLSDAPTWEEYGRSGESFFPQTGTSITTAEQTTYAGPGAVDILQNWGTFLPPVQIGTGGAARAAIAEQLRASAEYVSDIPAEVGEAGGEFVAELGAGVGAGVESVLTGVTAPITAIPGDLFEGIPSWVPLLGAAYLLTR